MKPPHPGETPQGATASLAASLGFAVLPPREDGAERPEHYKAPDVSLTGGTWEQCMREPPDPATVARWYDPEGPYRRRGVGLVTGLGGLELLEFDTEDVYEQYMALAEASGLATLAERVQAGYLEFTPGGGVHWLFRSDEPAPSTKLAARPKRPPEWTEKDRRTAEALAARGKEYVPWQSLIETKGRGGYVVVAPSDGPVHPTGNPYRLIRGGLGSLTRLSDDERDSLWELARSFDEKPPREEAAPKRTSPGRPPAGAARPGDDYNARASWDEVLGPEGWRRLFTRGETAYWCRPGKEAGVGATTNHLGTDRLHVFTSSTVFEPGTSYSKFGAVTRLVYGGDYAAAVRALAASGYGPPAAARAGPGPAARPPAVTPAPDPSPAAGLPGGYDALSDAELGLVVAAGVTPEPFRWAWPGRLARGAMNLIASEGGDGKGQIACACLAAVSAGTPWPDGSGPAERGTCLYLGAEDNLANTTVPRLIAAGADVGRVLCTNAKVTHISKPGAPPAVHYASLRDLSYWRTVLTRHAVSFMVIDPLPAYLGDNVNDHRNSELRAALMPFTDLCQELEVTLFCVTHVGKAVDRKNPVHRILGSVAYYNLARAVHTVFHDADDPARLLFALVKANQSATRDALAYRFEGCTFTRADGVAVPTCRVVFEPTPVPYHAAEEPGKARSNGAGTGNGTAPGRRSSATQRAAEWLYDRLYGVGWGKVVELIDEAGGLGLCGSQGEDGKWSNPGALFEAKKHFPALLAGTPRGDAVIDEERLESGRSGVRLLHWRLTPVDAPVAAPADIPTGLGETRGKDRSEGDDAF